MIFTNILLITQFKRSARLEMQAFFITINFPVNEKRSFQLLGKREKKFPTSRQKRKEVKNIPTEKG